MSLRQRAELHSTVVPADDSAIVNLPAREILAPPRWAERVIEVPSSHASVSLNSALACGATPRYVPA
jgi:hypothetical protein